jgi:hypothetical protein
MGRVSQGSMAVELATLVKRGAELNSCEIGSGYFH